MNEIPQHPTKNLPRWGGERESRRRINRVEEKVINKNYELRRRRRRRRIRRIRRRREIIERM